MVLLLLLFIIYLFIYFSEFDAERLTDSPDWNHVCIVRDSGIGITRYYLNGIQLDYQVCDGGALPAGKSLQLGGGNRKGTDVEMTGFYLWNRELTESDIINEAKNATEEAWDSLLFIGETLTTHAGEISR